MNTPMNTLPKLRLLTLPLLALSLSSAWADIQIHGSSDSYTETSGNWRSLGSNDIDGDGGLGTDGYLFFGDFDGVAESNQPFSHQVSSLPSYVTVAAGADFVSVASDFNSYGSIESPNSIGSLVRGGTLVARNATGLPAGDFVDDAFSFTIAGLPAETTVRVGVLSQIEGNSDGRWDPTSITLTDGTNSATVGDHSSNPLPTGASNVGWVFFDLDADGTYTLQGTKRLDGNQGIGFGGLTFDSIAPRFLAGQTIGIDFGGTEPISSSNFNHYSDLVIANGTTATESFPSTLMNTDGNPVSGIGFSVTNLTGQDTGRATVTNGAEGAFLMNDPSIYSDCIISNMTPSTPLTSGSVSPLTEAHFVLTFTGLDDSLVYNLSGGWDNNNRNFDAIWMANGEGATTTTSDGFVTLPDLSTDGNGTLQILVFSNTFHVTVGALQLTAVGQPNADGGLNFPAELPEGGYSFPDAFPGLTFNEIAFMESLPGNPNMLFVGERRGRIYIIPDVNAATPTRELFVDLQATLTNGSNNITLNGMGGIAFHPDFANNGYIYLSYPRRNQWSRVSRFTANPETFELVNNSTEQILFEESFHRAHGINRLLFGPDGYLYIPLGDGRQHEFGNPRPAATSLQTIDNQFWSAILRVDVDKRPGNYEPQNLTNDTNLGRWTVGVDSVTGLANYSIPADNPFLDQDAADGTGVNFAYGRAVNPNTVRTEMWATGFRNPWKIGFVPGTSDLWVADVMSARKEKYMIVPKGGNAGWAFFSGTGEAEVLQTSFNVPVPSGVQYIQPVVEYLVTDSGSGSNNKSIIGGEFYQSTDIAPLTGAFLMCDFNRGDIWAVHRDDHSDFQLVDTVQLPNGNFVLDDIGIEESTVGGVFAFGTYNATIERIGVQTGITAMLPNPSTGEMLLADFDDDIIRKVVFSAGDFDSQLPQTLSQTGAFEDVENFEVTSEMNPYDVNLTFWSDGALKSRFFNMVDAEAPMQYSQDDFWNFPAGMVAMKHFDLDLDRDNPGTNLRRIETRFLVKVEDDFYGMTYQWNEEGTEAFLVGEEGGNLDLPVTEGGVTSTQTWRLPSRAECYQCHTASNNVMIGLSTRQLNRLGDLGDASGNFLELLESAGYLSPIGSDPASLPAFSKPSDLAVNIEERVQSYLAVNCAYCHYEGNGIVPASWSGEHQLTIEETNLLHGEAIGFNVVDTTDRLIIPGDTANSIILSRTAATNGYSRMPPIGSNIVDPEGIALLTEWIDNFANAQPEFSGVTGPFNILENSPATTNVGVSLGALDPDFPDATRGELTYSIVSGNAGGFFDIDSATGQITISQPGLDFEEATSHQLLVRATDGFVANPGEATANVTINVQDLLNDDSQGDGIADEWAIDFFGVSAINPAADADGDGSIELLEYYANTNPTDASDQGFILEPTGAITTPGNEGFLFEWVIRTSLVIDSDYIVQGSNALDFEDLEPTTDFELMSTTPVDATVSRIQVKVPTTSDKYFLRLRGPN